MRSRIEATNALETRLAQVFLNELLDPRIEVEGIDADDTQVDIILDGEIDDHDDYASYELVVAPVSELDITYKFHRAHDTTQDHIVTVEFDRIEPDTAQVPRYSAPYELIDIQDCSSSVEIDIEIEDCSTAFELLDSSAFELIERSGSAGPRSNAERCGELIDEPREPREAPPAGLSVRTQAWFAAEPTDIIEPDEYEAPRGSSSRQIVVFAVLVLALALGLSLALFAI